MEAGAVSDPGAVLLRGDGCASCGAALASDERSASNAGIGLAPWLYRGSGPAPARGPSRSRREVATAPRAPRPCRSGCGRFRMPARPVGERDGGHRTRLWRVRRPCPEPGLPERGDRRQSLRGPASGGGTAISRRRRPPRAVRRAPPSAAPWETSAVGELRRRPRPTARPRSRPRPRRRLLGIRPVRERQRTEAERPRQGPPSASRAMRSRRWTAWWCT